jgi:hypothetical protein
MRYVEISVKRDGNTTNVSTVPEWEFPILEFIFGKGNVVDTGKAVNSDRPYPEAGAEFARLAKVYGGDAKSGIAHVISVYGEGIRGVRSLREAIEDAQKADKAAAKKPAASKRQALAADPLLA